MNRGVVPGHSSLPSARARILLASALTIFTPLVATAQQPPPRPIASFSFPSPFGISPATNADAGATPDTATSADATATQPAANEARPREDVSIKSVPMDILGDQKYVWLFPVDLARGRHWVPTVVIAGLTAGLVVGDRYDEPYFFHTTRFNRFNETFNRSSSEAMIAVVPVSLFVWGIAGHHEYAEQTAILAGEAYIDSAIPHLAIKLVARRLRPDATPLNGNYSDTFFRSNLSPLSNGSSFPSGHAAGAFSVATVIARRYGSHRWVPRAAYGLAALLSFSRITDREHYPSDVFLGAALGYAITRYDLFREQ